MNSFSQVSHTQYGYLESKYYKVTWGLRGWNILGKPPRYVFYERNLVTSVSSRSNTNILSYSLSADTYAVAGMALQCVKDAGSQVHNAAELDAALTKIKQKLLASRRPDGHIGNEFSTGLAVQVKIFFLMFLSLSPNETL